MANYQERRVNQILVITAPPGYLTSITHPSHKDFFERLQALQRTPITFILNLEHVQHLGSEALDELVATLSAYRAAGKRIFVCCATPRIQISFLIIRITLLLNVYPTEEEAIAVALATTHDEERRR